MRAVPGAHFLFTWNPNVCTADLPLSQWYPGNSYGDRHRSSCSSHPRLVVLIGTKALSVTR